MIWLWLALGYCGAAALVTAVVSYIIDSPVRWWVPVLWPFALVYSAVMAVLVLLFG